jgi:hypothetical protein
MGRPENGQVDQAFQLGAAVTGSPSAAYGAEPFLRLAAQNLGNLGWEQAWIVGQRRCLRRCLERRFGV